MKISRTIEIDAGHRIPEHANKCRNLHGHRYVIMAQVSSEELQTQGNERGMVMDFGRIRDAMMANIHDRFDHKMILRWDDPVAETLIGVKIPPIHPSLMFGAYLSEISEFCLLRESPTAEYLAQLWFRMLAKDIDICSIRVYETPNCYADYSG